MEDGTNLSIRKVLSGFLKDNEQIVLEKLKVGPGPDQEAAVHALRVATKKLRAVMRMIGHVRPDDFLPKKELKKLRLLFRFAGVLRELHVDAGILDHFEGEHLIAYKELRHLMNAEQAYARQLFEQSKKDFKLKHLHLPVEKGQKVLKGIKKDELMDATRTMTALRLKAIQQVMPKDYDRVLIHKARILLKEATYLMGLLHAGGDTESYPIEMVENAKLAGDFAGEWHDRDCFAQWFRIQIRPGGPVSATDPQYRLLQQDLQVQIKQLSDEFRMKLSEVVDISPPEEDLVGNTGEM